MLRHKTFFFITANKMQLLALVCVFLFPTLFFGQSQEKLIKQGAKSLVKNDLESACNYWLQASSKWPRKYSLHLQAIKLMLENCDKYNEAPSFSLEQYSSLEESSKTKKIQSYFQKYLEKTGIKPGKISLESLKGSYVYIDFWATWCGPCIRQQAPLKKLEEKLKGANVKFVSISLDEKENYSKWREMIKEKALTGIHLISEEGFAGNLPRSYKVNSIPSFVLISPDGKLLSLDSYWPSDSQAYILFEELLNL